ncbi:MAG TPA: phosphoadenosine phosphosulfate reductase family protein, partial [Acidobacteriaceae bacterium]|nr:phosphoadenosine phosphosulfate reductase family protein [Acidobacteriaceae bacterium]
MLDRPPSRDDSSPHTSDRQAVSHLPLLFIASAPVEVSLSAIDATVQPAALNAERLNHLKALEAESIYILREAVAEFARPVMLYSIGKDSSVMLRLAQKAFFPGKIPFPLLHIDTGYKFPEMIAF